MKENYIKEYAVALFDIALDDEKLDDIKDQLAIVCLTMKENPSLLKLINHPQIDKKEKKRIIKKIYHEIDMDIINFLYVLIDNNRIIDIYDINESFLFVYHEYQKIIIVKAVTTIKLNPEQTDRLIKRLEKKYRHKIVINNMIDSSIIGGMRLIINDEIIDNTIRTQIVNIKSHILKET